MGENDLVKTNTDKDAKPRPTAFIYGGVTFVIVVSALGGYMFLSRPKVSADYINKFDAVATLYQKLGTDSDTTSKQLTGMVQSLENAKDYNSAVKIVDQDLTIIKNLAAEVSGLNSSIADFNVAAEKVSDPTVRGDSLQVVSLWQQGNTSFLGVLGYETQYLSSFEQYYENMAAGRKADLLTDVQAKAISQGIQNDTDSMSSIGVGVEAAYSKLSQDLGVQLQAATTTGQ